MESQVANESPEKEISPEEYKKIRLDAIKHLKDEITYLKVETEYQKLQAEIESHKAQRLMAIHKQAEIMYSSENKSDKMPQEMPEEMKKERKLKTH
tara:strand:- start:563 stop:850 length:288 start_codon:yes stop_codon:yes gene_type:complete